jgi:hypothetical protein
MPAIDLVLKALNRRVLVWHRSRGDTLQRGISGKGSASMSKSRWGVCLAAGAAMVGSVHASHAASGFDGSWSVSVQSSFGKCEASAHYALRVENGRIRHDGGDAVVSGSVDGRGNIRVSILQNGHGASGSGHLSGSTGVGTWRGHRSAIVCGGRWEAQRL